MFKWGVWFWRVFFFGLGWTLAPRGLFALVSVFVFMIALDQLTRIHARWTAKRLYRRLVENRKELARIQAWRKDTGRPVSEYPGPPSSARAMPYLVIRPKCSPGSTTTRADSA